MNFNVEARKLQLENLEQIISSSKDKIQNVLDLLGWNVEDVMQDKHLITCSLDPNHKVPQNSIEKHIKKCALRKEGYDLNEKFLSEPITGTSSVHIDDHKKIEILSAAHKSIENFKSDNEIDKVVLMPQYNQIYLKISFFTYPFIEHLKITYGWNGQDPDPKTADRLATTFSADERLALYNYAVANTSGPAVLPEFDVFSVNQKGDDCKPLALEEKLVLERDLKRRKIKYKSVHTNHKNYTEVMREVIEGQMELYTDWLNITNPDPANIKTEEIKLDLEQARSTAESRNSNNSGSFKTTIKSEDKYSEKVINSTSTSRRTSLDRGSDRSYSETRKYRRPRSRSRDNYNRRKEDDYHRHREKRNLHNYRKRSPFNKHERRSRERRRSRSRDRRRNGHRDYRN